MKSFLIIISLFMHVLFATDNYALMFDGIDDYVEIENSDDLNPNNALTVSLHFKTEDAGRVQYIFGNETQGTSNGFSIHLRESGALWFQMVSQSNGNSY